MWGASESCPVIGQRWGVPTLFTTLQTASNTVNFHQVPVNAHSAPWHLGLILVLLAGYTHQPTVTSKATEAPGQLIPGSVFYHPHIPWLVCLGITGSDSMGVPGRLGEKRSDGEKEREPLLLSLASWERSRRKRRRREREVRRGCDGEAAAESENITEEEG